MLFCRYGDSRGLHGHKIFSSLLLFSKIEYLQLNGNNVGVAHATDVPGGLSMSVHSTLKLQAGDKISLVLSEGVVHDFFNNYSNFVGWLLEEHDFVMCLLISYSFNNI